MSNCQTNKEKMERTGPVQGNEKQMFTESGGLVVRTMDSGMGLSGFRSSYSHLLVV